MKDVLMCFKYFFISLNVFKRQMFKTCLGSIFLEKLNFNITITRASQLALIVSLGITLKKKINVQSRNTCNKRF